MGKIFEYRGVSDVVYAEVTKDDNEASGGYVTGEVKTLAPVAEIGKTTESSSEAHYYDNQPLIVVDSTGADEVTLTLAGIPLEVVADVTGQYYDKALGAMVEGDRTPKYFALGYRTQKTDGTEMLVWRYKGTFSIPEQTSTTTDDGTDGNGQELTYTGISTTHKFTKTGKGAKALVVDTGDGTADVSAFFDTVTTPDSLKAVS